MNANNTIKIPPVKMFIIMVAAITVATSIISIYADCQKKRAVSYLNDPLCVPEILGIKCSSFNFFFGAPNGPRFNKECDASAIHQWFECVPDGDWDISKSPPAWTNAPPYSNIWIVEFSLQRQGVASECANEQGFYYCNFNGSYQKVTGPFTFMKKVTRVCVDLKK